MLIDFGFVVATHGDLSEADADFSAIERLYEEQDALSAFDAVTIAKKASGEARFGRRHQRGVLVDERPVEWSLAAGLLRRCTRRSASTCRLHGWSTSRS